MMTLSVERTLFAAIVVVVCGVASVNAQQSEAEAPPFTLSLERIRAALQAQPPIMSDGASLLALRTTACSAADVRQCTELRWGVLTVVPCPGLFICVNVPIGDLVSNAAHFVAASQHRRAENAAHAEVVKALADFQQTQSK